ncbi:MAG: hypothetical protein GC159_10940 [Phycisphaera sp.]|nr:hypothetical protein [Phycisphaera sp.]
MKMTQQKTIGQIKLIPAPDTLLAIPAECSEHDKTITPVEVPRLPTSFVSWMLGLSLVARTRVDRSVASLLLFDLHVGRWSVCVPKQWCGIDGARWSTNRSDYPDLPDHVRIGGSFQPRTGLSGDEIADAIPLISGIHFIEQTVGMDHAVHLFIRYGSGALDRVSPMAVTYDDWEQAAFGDPEHVRFE